MGMVGLGKTVERGGQVFVGDRKGRKGRKKKFLKGNRKGLGVKAQGNLPPPPESETKKKGGPR